MARRADWMMNSAKVAWDIAQLPLSGIPISAESIRINQMAEAKSKVSVLVSSQVDKLWVGRVKTWIWTWTYPIRGRIAR